MTGFMLAAAGGILAVSNGRDLLAHRLRSPLGRAASR
jgi:hypothetical protein